MPRACHPRGRSDLPSRENVAPPSFRDAAVVELQPAVLDAVEHGVEIGALARLAPQFHVVGKAALREVLHPVRCVIAAVDGPVVGQPDHEAPAGAVADIRHQESAPARRLFERFVKHRRVEHREFAQAEDRPVRDRPIARHDVELGAAESPPWRGHFAVGDQPLVQDVLVADPLGPFALEIDGVIGGEHAGPGVDAGDAGPVDFVHRALLGLGVVIHVVGPDLLVPLEIVVVDVTARGEVAGFAVVVDLVRLEEHGGAFHFRVAAQMVLWAFRLLNDPLGVPLTWRWGVGPRDVRRLVGPLRGGGGRR